MKLQIGRLILPIELEDIMQAAKLMGFAELPVSAAHAGGVRHLPPYHRDPFDRLLIAEAINEPARWLTANAILGRYPNLVDVIV